jgi:hypothetical protein
VRILSHMLKGYIMIDLQYNIATMSLSSQGISCAEGQFSCSLLAEANSDSS